MVDDVKKNDDASDEQKAADAQREAAEQRAEEEQKVGAEQQQLREDAAEEQGGEYDPVAQEKNLRDASAESGAAVEADVAASADEDSEDA